MSDTQAYKNTNVTIWRKFPEYDSPEIFVTEDGLIGINFGGSVFVKPVEMWHYLATVDMRTKYTRPTRWHDGMRAFDDAPVATAQMPHEKLCWGYVGPKEVCIQKRGHDNNAHEPEVKS